MSSTNGSKEVEAFKASLKQAVQEVFDEQRQDFRETLGHARRVDDTRLDGVERQLIQAVGEINELKDCYQHIDRTLFRENGERSWSSRLQISESKIQTLVGEDLAERVKVIEDYVTERINSAKSAGKWLWSVADRVLVYLVLAYLAYVLKTMPPS